MARFITLTAWLAVLGCSAASEEGGVSGPRLVEEEKEESPKDAGSSVSEDVEKPDAAAKKCGQNGGPCCASENACSNEKALCCTECKPGTPAADCSCGEDYAEHGKCKVCCARCKDGSVKSGPVQLKEDETCDDAANRWCKAEHESRASDESGWAAKCD